MVSEQKAGIKKRIFDKKCDLKQTNEMKCLVGQLEKDEVYFLLREGAWALRVIQKKTNTSIFFPSKKGDSKRDVFMKGSEEDKSMAWLMILEQFRKGLVEQLENDEVCFLLRKGAHALTVIEKKTNTSISLKNNKGDGKGEVVIKGSEDDNSKAWSMIMEQLRECLVGQLENDEVRLLLRDGGQAVCVIEKKTNTLIFCPSKKGDSKRHVFIEGYKGDKVEAWSLMLKHIGCAPGK